MNPKEGGFRRKAALGIGGLALLGASGVVGEKLASEHGDKASEVLRQTIGTDATIWLEDKYFSFKDFKNRTRDFALGVDEIENQLGETNEIVREVEIAPNKEVTLPSHEETVSEDIFKTPTPEASKPLPLFIPEVKLIQQPIPGEGIWTTDGLPHSTPEDTLMAKTIIRPDVQRPRSQVGVLLVDKRRADLHMVGGTESPGWEYGVVGPGKVYDKDLPNLMVAWKGGFLGPDGNYGMYADGKLYRPLVNGLASVATTQDGEILMGEWGKTLSWREDMTAVRQNAMLLVENCEVTDLAKNQEQNTGIWGRVWLNSAEFITWRSAIGLTQNGDLMVAAGENVSAKTLAMGLQAAGACTAMQLDINNPQVLISIFEQQPNGLPTAKKLMKEMTEPNPMRFINRIQNHDFMYLTYNNDERYKAN